MIIVKEEDTPAVCQLLVSLPVSSDRVPFIILSLSNVFDSQSTSFSSLCDFDSSNCFLFKWAAS